MDRPFCGTQVRIAGQRRCRGTPKSATKRPKSVCQRSGVPWKPASLKHFTAERLCTRTTNGAPSQPDEEARAPISAVTVKVFRRSTYCYCATSGRFHPFVS